MIPTLDPLAALRSRIDALDDQIIKLLAERYALLPEVVKVKAANGISHRVQARVEQGRARSFDELIAIGRARGYKNPRYWAQMVMGGRR